MQEPIVVFEDNSEASNGSEGPFPRYLLDGRNRRDALRLLGIKGEVEIPHGSITCDPVRTINAMCRATGSNGLPDGWKVNTDPVTFVLSMNVRRRHLTSEQKRAAIEAYAKANPKASNRKVAKDLGVSDHTVADVRGDQNSQNANIDHSRRACQAGSARQSGTQPARCCQVGRSQPGHGRQSPQGDR